MVPTDNPFEGAADIEEITLGLPAQDAPHAALDEQWQINRYLLQSIRQFERELLEIERVETLLLEAATGLRRTLGCSDIRLVLHDPVGALAQHVRDVYGLEASVRFTADSTDVTEHFDTATPRWLPRAALRALGVAVESTSVEGALAIPLVESGVIVGVAYCIGPRTDLLANDADLALMGDFGRFLPLALRRTGASQEASELMLLDPETHIANRSGLERDLEREISRARRSHKPVSLVVVGLAGLENMGNLSQRHFRSVVLRQVANRLAAALRVTDSMGRLGPRYFGILIAEAPTSVVRDIAWRFEQDIKGMHIDNGAGGVIEVQPNTVFTCIEPASLKDSDPAELAALMIESGTAAVRDEDGDRTLIREVLLPVSAHRDEL